MLPYSAVAAIDYAAYQSRPGLTTSNGAPLGASFTHSWLVPTQDLCGVNFKPDQQQNQLIVDPGHVENFFFIRFRDLIS
ncbi:CLUMA_CG010733, isoform A [Clunio marinus]|uniref:CLUMA_CG010733, isoform A n=1 Tax=Clunio marinus TaxID=568069 RepID=A0A1J1IEB5_9DIPT|nr:CLUMA_CG010733, isoform A [Clunio marinus]